MSRNDYDDDELVTLRLANGKEVEFVALAGIPYKGEYYVVMQPTKSYEDLSEDEALVFRVTRDRDGNDRYDIVLEDRLLEQLHKEYEKLLDEQGIE